MAANFFETGTGGTGSINPGDLQTIVNARDATLAAKTAAETAQALAASAQAAAVSAASGVQAVANTAATQAANAAAAASTATTAATTAAASVTDATTQVALAVQNASDAQLAADTAEGAVGAAQDWASAPAGQQVAPGLESAKSYAGQAKQAVTSAISMDKRVLADADFAGGNYTLVRTDLVSYIVCTNTSAGNIVLPPGLFNDAGPSGGDGVAAVHVVKRGAGNVTFGVPGGASVIPPNRLIDQLFTYSTSAPVASYTPATAHRVVVPAGTKRKLTLMWFSVHNQTTQSTVSLTASNTTNLTKRIAEATTATGWFSSATGAGVMAAMWTADLADSATATNVDVSPTATLPFCYALWALATGNTAATSGYAGTSSGQTAATSTGQALTPAEAQDMLAFGLAFQGADASPLTLSGGGSPTTAQTGQTGPVRTSKDLTVLFGYEVRPNTTAETYTGTSAKSAETAKLGIILQPNTVGGGGSSVITGGGTPTLSTVGAHATVWLDSDGLTYDVET